MSFLDMLAPIVGGIIGGVATGGNPFGAAAGSAIATTAATGDVEQGIMSGITGYGIGSVMGTVGTSLAAKAATEAATQSAAQVATQGAAQTAAQSAALQATTGGAGAVVPQTTSGIGGVFNRAGNYMSALSQPKSFLPIYTGETARQARATEMAGKNSYEDWEKEEEEKNKKSRGQMAGVYDRVRQAYPQVGYFAGGSINVSPISGGYDFRVPNYSLLSEETLAAFPAARVGQGAGGDIYSGGYNVGSDSGASISLGMLPNPNDIQLSQRGQFVRTPPRASYSALDVGGEGYMPGVDPEFQYFSDVDPNQNETSGPPPEELAYGGQIPMNPYNTQDYSSIPSAMMSVAPQYYAGGQMYAEGGQVAPPQGMGQQQPDLVQMTVAAIRGEIAEPEPIIQAFVAQYGPEAFGMLRDQVLKEIVPGAQTEGMVQGQGGGQDDMVNGMIGSQRPVAVSPGEYIVPADAVSLAGGGYSGDGAKYFDNLINDIRSKTTGSTEQARPYR